jgi:hypothetical protein
MSIRGSDALENDETEGSSLEGTYFILHDSARLFLRLGFDIHRHHLTALHLLFTSDTIAYPDKANILGIATASIVEGCPFAIISFNTPRIIDSA